MHAPVLVTPPTDVTVTLEEAKLHLRVEGDDENTLITGLIAGAVSHLDGWTGVLGGALADQTWRQDFDSFACTMRLPIGPVTEIVSITYRDADGQLSTVADSNYALVTDAIGPRVFWDAGFSAPTGLYEQGAVSVTYQAGYDVAPPAIKVAILLMVGHWYMNRETVAAGSFSELPFAANALLAPFRRISI